MLEETRRRLAKRRGWLRRVRSEDRLTVKPSPGDALRDHLSHEDKLLKRGAVAWAALIQANAQLYEIGDGWRPGEVITSADPHFDSQPDELQRVAEAIFELKGTLPLDPAMRTVAEEITNEHTRASAAPVPDSLASPITKGRAIVRHTIIFDRAHLPEGVLAERIMPVLHHADCNCVLLLPAAIWADGLREYWRLPEEVKSRLETEHAEREKARKERPLLEVSDDAIAHIRKILHEIGEPACVRVTYSGGSHSMGMIPPDGVLDDDVQFELEGINFIIDPKSAEVIWGSSIDFVTRGPERGFVFDL